ncbi:hypothetical protein [Actinokineospora enzanensis]|uniref:hypothetical protein n=1 Tax=Actinokineospora enzanensis TaxID=155975 RepID=UPI0003672004|nr:hypothetical protein [Actinokineospora enzanensis]
MTSSGPWWATPLIALVGTVGGVVLTLLVSGRRDARSRFGDRKRVIYADFLGACDELRQLRIWPADQPTAPVIGRIRAQSMHTVLVAHRAVTEALSAAVEAAARLAAVVDEIRSTSTPGYGGAVDERRRPRYTEATAAFDAALNEFVRVARTDIDVRTAYAPPFPANR